MLGDYPAQREVHNFPEDNFCATGMLNTDRVGNGAGRREVEELDP